MTTLSEFDPATYDHHSPTHAKNWRAIHDEMRAVCPVAHSPNYGGYYVLTRYEDVAAALKDDATFASKHEPGSPMQGIIIPEIPSVSTPIEMDPPESTPYRKLLNKHFSPGASQGWAPWLREVTTALIDDFVEDGHADLVTQFASPLPALLTAKLLGLPLDDWRLYSDVSHDIVRFGPNSPEFPGIIARHGEMLDRAMQTVRQRREEPADDLLTAIIGLEIDGRPISDERVIEFATLIIGGGNDTTTGLFGNALDWLAAHPQERELLRAEPERIGSACEEFLRFFTPTQALGRTVTRDVEFAGHSFKKNDRVLLSFAAANFDPEIFVEPHEVRLDRFPNRHQAFGLGLHRCSGSTFTRIEFQIGIEELLRRIPDYTVDPTSSKRYNSIGTVNGWDNLAVNFTPGKVEGSTFTL